MKKCPTCGKEFEDSMKFCQVDGTELPAAEPAFDPYATVVGYKLDKGAEKPAEETSSDAGPSTEASVAETAAGESIAPVAEAIHETTGSIPIAPPDEVLDLPGVDPLKTMYVSESELKEAFGSDAKPAAPQEPPPSPFSVPESPVMRSDSGEMETVLADPTAGRFQDAAPVAEWSPPAVPEAAWQQQRGSNMTPQPVGAAGGSKGLAIGSLVCGILSCLCCFSVLTGPAAMIMGFIAKKNADENPSEFGGRGLALGGMITGAVGLVLGIGLIILQVFFGALNGLMRELN